MQTSFFLMSILFLYASESTPKAPPEHAPQAPVVQWLHAEDVVSTVRWNTDLMRRRYQSKRPFVIENMPISATKRVDLELTPFSIANSNTRFVIGRPGQPDKPFTFDTTQVRAFRGQVKGLAGSDVFLVFGNAQSAGYIDMGVGRGRHLLSAKGKNGASLPRGTTTIFPASGGGFQPPVPFCGTDTAALSSLTVAATTSATAVPQVAQSGSWFVKFAQHVELAIDTDFAYFSLFNDRDAAAEYIVQMYTQVSHIFLRDTNARFELVLVRLWDDPALPIGGLDGAFDVAQRVSGTRNASAGGQAFGGLCGSGVASVIYYVLGFFPDPTMPSPYHYDIVVAAHELGHNAGAPHTHQAGIDRCNNALAPPQRGTIMSNCGQSYSGLNADIDLYFHRLLATGMTSRFQGASCVVTDCNMNHIDDDIDIQKGSSPDVNANSIPDECEDCNGNGILDDVDIASNPGSDLNNNTIPDACEPDCNGNGVPDSMDIANESSTDLYGNSVPDECETDCNANGTSDYSEIQVDMPRDVDRNAVLDACQDCDDDGITDHAALEGGHNLWIASGLFSAPLREYFATTGVLVRESTDPTINEGQDVVITPDGRILVSSAGTNRVMAFDRSGAFIEDIVPSDTPGLDYPTGLLVLPDGRLLVASRNTANILQFNATTGAPMGEFVTAGSGGLVRPYGMTLGPNGNLFVTSRINEVIEYDGITGAFVRVFVKSIDNGGLMQPRDLVFKPDGHLLVTSFATGQVLEYDRLSGAPMGSWVVLGFNVPGMTPVNPWGIEIGPNGNVFVSRAVAASSDLDDTHADADGTHLHLSNAQVFEYDVCNGFFVRVHIGGNDHGLKFPTGFAFMPGWDQDCNFNLLPDSCDLASGFSLDQDGNQISDECDVDCNGNGRQDRLDIVPLGDSFDCNRNGSPDECDIASGLSNDCNFSGIPDECEPDCDGVIATAICGIEMCSTAECSAKMPHVSCFCPQACVQTSCGDSCCTGLEHACNCPVDCPSQCGDGCCTGDENCGTCPEDCPEDICGNGCCEPDEVACMCPDDCEPFCGDGCCDSSEDGCVCPEDCSPVCGNGCCDPSEDACICPEDCSPVCGDGCCNGDETCDVCIGDGCCFFDVCPVGSVVFLDPFSGTLDSRQPHPPDDPTHLQGISTFSVRGPAGAELRVCWNFCESQSGAIANDIASVVDDGPVDPMNPSGNHFFTVTLTQPLTAGAVTIITYTDGTAFPFTGFFAVHPGDVEANGQSNAGDIQALTFFINNGGGAPLGILGEDIDRSGKLAPGDLLRLIDLLNGANGYDRAWMGTLTPECGACCQP